jgi:hypothetical protein
MEIETRSFQMQMNLYLHLDAFEERTNNRRQPKQSTSAENRPPPLPVSHAPPPGWFHARFMPTRPARRRAAFPAAERVIRAVAVAPLNPAAGCFVPACCDRQS